MMPLRWNRKPSPAFTSEGSFNPFNPTTTISYSVAHASYVTLKVFDVLGRMVSTLVSEPVTAGVHNVRWDATVGSGVYFYELNAGGVRQTKRMILMK